MLDLDQRPKKMHHAGENTADTPSLLYETVVQGGYCIGCGACAAVKGSPVQMRLDDQGRYEATWAAKAGPAAVEQRLLGVCPFSNHAGNEDEIGRDLFGEGATYDKHIGYYRSTYAGYVAEGHYRARGSSGGMGKWILTALLQEGLVDAVIQVKPNPPDDEDAMVYRYRVLRSVEEAQTGSKSVYYPVEMTDVLAYVRAHPGRYAITGVPCFIKAVRLLARQESVFAERIVFCVGLICGHMKSTKYADMIAWQFGVEPGDLASIDFRKKLPGARANHKGVVVESRRPEAEVREPDIVQHLFGTNYNHGFFQYRACDYCDDVVGETADVSVGDAWLQEYLPDGGGTSVIVIRNPVIDQLVQRAMDDGRVQLQALSVDRVVESQAGGFRQRREGLAYRLHLADKAGVWRPTKRVPARAYHIRRKRKDIYRLRTRMSEQSHGAFQRAVAEGDFQLFQQEMETLLARYDKLYKPTFWHRIKRGVQRRVERIVKRIKGSA